MSQVGGQRVSSIESEQSKSSVGGGGGGGGGSVGGRKSAQKSGGGGGDCEVLDTHALIDAGNVAALVPKGQQLQQQASESAERGSQSQKLHRADASQEFDKTNYQSAELNNNSIAGPSAEAPQKLLETPLSLLTGLRMHTSNLRAAQTSGEQQAAAQVTRRKALIGKTDEQSTTASESQPPRGSHSNVTSSTKVPYVESSLNPQETPISKTSSHSPYTPSYTSLFNYQKPAASTASPSPNQQAKISAPTSVSSYSQHVFSESVRKSTSTRSQSPLIKHPVQQQPSDLSARSLLSTASRQAESSKRLPSIFDHSRGRLRDPVDYDESASDRRRRLQRLAAANREDDIENIIDYEAGEEVDDDDDEHLELDYTERGPDDQSLSSGQSGTQRASNLLANLKQQTSVEQAGKRQATSSSPESQRTGATHLIHQSNKYPGSSSRLTAAARTRGRSSAGREKLETKISMGSQQQLGSGKKLVQGSQSHSQTRISMMNEMSRPPSFNTTTQQLDGHETKSASCRKLDLLEQAAHLDCTCHTCSKNRKLAESLYHYHSHHQLGSTSKIPNLKLNKTGDKNYPKTRVMHMVLKSIILVLCTLLLLLLLVGTTMVSIYLPQSMDKVVGATRQFNVTIAGRR